MVDIKITFNKNEMDLAKYILDKEDYEEYLKKLVLNDIKQENGVIEEVEECDLDKLFDSSVFDYEV